MHKDQLNIEWWKQAADLSPIPIAFVDVSNRFIYINNAWSVLTGYSSSELVERKTWQDITELDDIGGDQESVKDTVEGFNTGFYLAKTYIHKDGTKINVGIFVHKHPPFGSQDGFIVFANPKDSDELILLKNNYNELVSSVNFLERQQAHLAKFEQKIESISDSVAAMQQTILSLISNNKGSINVGGSLAGGHQSGRDSNSSSVILFTVIGLAVIGSLLFGSKLMIDMHKMQMLIENVIK